MGRAAEYLNPCFAVKRTTVIMSTAELAGVAVKNPGDVVCSLGEHRGEIIGALDFLITGL